MKLKFNLFTAAVAVMLFAVSAELAKSQVLNVERLRGDVDREPGWVGELRFDASLNKYRDQVLRLGNQTNAGYYSEQHAYLLLNSINLVNVDGASVVSSGHVHLRGTFYRTRTWSPELFTQYQYNLNMGMKGRYLAGGAIRYTFINSDDITGHIGTGFMYEYERWDIDESELVEKNLLKSTTNLVIRGLLNPQVELLMIGYYQSRPDNFFQPRIISENQLNIRISQRLTFSVNFTLNYDFNPVIDVPELTYVLSNGIVFSL
jgi:hypothetical protein